MNNRLKKCIDYLISVDRVKSPAHFAESIGKQRSFISEILSGKRTVSEQMVHLITSRFPEISDCWLMRGEGSMTNVQGIYDRINKILCIEGMPTMSSDNGTYSENFIFPGVYRSDKNNPADIKVAAGWVECISRLFPKYSEEWIKYGEGPMSIEKQHTYSNQNIHFHNNRISGSTIPLINIDAFADADFESTCNEITAECYRVSEFKNADFLIRVNGNSMSPKYTPGDLIACKIVKNAQFFQWNKIYVIHTKSQGVMVNRVKKSNNDGCILLVSDNPIYDPFDVPLNDVQAFALVIGVIRVE